jgi:hypothetical protein
MSSARTWIVVAALGLAVVGCSQAPTRLESLSPPSASSAASSASASVVPASPAGPAAPLITVETRGGECPEGACGSVVRVEADGTLHQLKPVDSVLGTVPAELVEALRIEIEQANYPLLQSRPFTGECPVNVDGQETIYTFHVATGDERMASCEVEIDENHPLFRAVAAVLSSAGA